MTLKIDHLYIEYHIGNSDVNFIEISREAGYCNDYEYLDLNLGISACKDVYPKIYE